jgi:SAM-dependent methyltransferase
MKARDSEMPAEEGWQAFFDPDCVINKLDCVKQQNDVIAEFGCGYGTFTLPVAKRTAGLVYAFDIEADLVALVNRKARVAGLANVRAQMRDFVNDGTGLTSASVDHAMVYNLLHLEEPVPLLREAYRILKTGGLMSIIHWNCDPSTPRGPAMHIRPRPEQCRVWSEVAGFEFVRNQDLSECCQYHYGMLMIRPDK